MTTTLRPSGPERLEAEGGRSRTYDVCVNGRPVGVIELATDERFGPSAGRIRSLCIDEADRRRGRATVALLAAEEVLRGWGCRRVEAGIPAAEPAAVRLAAALGYVECNRFMAKELPAVPPELPGGSVARPLGEAEYPDWLARKKAGYVRGWVARGMAPAEAELRSEAAHRTQLPDGPASADTALRVVAHEGADVGTVWVALRPPYLDGGWVFDVEVSPEHRGAGHGRTLMLVAEGECVAAGHTRIGLNVFAGNTPAERLYASLGYGTTEHHVAKPLL